MHVLVADDCSVVRPVRAICGRMSIAAASHRY